MNISKCAITKTNYVHALQQIVCLIIFKHV